MKEINKVNVVSALNDIIINDLDVTFRAYFQTVLKHAFDTGEVWMIDADSKNLAYTLAFHGFIDSQCNIDQYNSYIDAMIQYIFTGGV